MHDRRDRDHFGNFEIAIAPRFIAEFVQQPRGHDHHLDLVETLRDLEMRTIPLGLEGVSLCAHGSGPADDFRFGKTGPETPDHFGVKLFAEMKNVSGVRVEHEDDFNAGGFGAGQHPADTILKSLPVGLTVFKRQQRRDAETGIGGVIDEGFLGRVRPDGFLPGRGGGEFRGVTDHDKESVAGSVI